MFGGADVQPHDHAQLRVLRDQDPGGQVTYSNGITNFYTSDGCYEFELGHGRDKCTRERDVTMKKFPMSHTTAPSVATGHSLKPSDHADLDVRVHSVPASAITDEEEEEGGSRGGSAHI